VSRHILRKLQLSLPDLGQERRLSLCLLLTTHATEQGASLLHLLSVLEVSLLHPLLRLLLCKPSAGDEITGDIRPSVRVCIPQLGKLGSVLLGYVEAVLCLSSDVLRIRVRTRGRSRREGHVLW
jgi:hypothetical protein